MKMPKFWDHERFQIHCRFCSEVHEADSAEEADRMVIAHERECPKNTEGRKLNAVPA